MASFTFVLLATSLLVATSSAAPQNTKPHITVPEQCRGKGFCTIRPEGYDKIEAKINSLLPLHLINVGSRLSGNADGFIEDSSDGDDNCPSTSYNESVYIYDHPNKTKVDIIVQTDLLPQTITQVKCDDKTYKTDKEGDLQCFRSLGLSYFSINFKCKESYANQSLLVYDPDKNDFRKENYPVSVCCSCVTKI